MHKNTRRKRPRIISHREAAAEKNPDNPPTRRKRAKKQAKDSGNRYVVFILSIFDRLQWLARLFSVDYRRFRALLEVQLRLDLRRGDNPSSQGFQKNPGLISLIYIGIGFLGASGLLIENPILGMGASLSLVGMMTFMLLISDHMATFLDATDASIAGPLPVDDRTFFAARSAHIIVFLARTAGLIGASSFVFGSIVYGPWIFLPVYLLSLLLTCVLCLLTAFGAILLIFRVLGQQRARNLILLAQIGVTVGLIGGMQVIPHMIDAKAFESMINEHSWALLLAPPFYFGGLLALATGSVTQLSVTLSCLAILVPLLFGFIVLRLAAGGFVADISSLALTSTGRGKPRQRKRKPWYDRFIQDPVRRAGFDFFRALSRREKHYRLRTYPSLAISFIMSVVASLASGHFEPRLLCVGLYMLGANTPTMLIPARFSETPKARWILSAGPQFDASRFSSGCLQAHLFTLQIPALLILAALIFITDGPRILPDLCFALSAATILTLYGAKIAMKTVPFTRKIVKQATTEFMIEGIILLGMGIGFGIVHAMAHAFHIATYLYLAPIFTLPIAVSLAKDLRRLPQS